MAELQNAVVQGVVGVLVVIIGIAFSGVKDYLIAKSNQLKVIKSESGYETIRAMARIAVNATEQMYKDLHGKQKLLKATGFF